MTETLPRLPKKHCWIWKAKTGLKTQEYLIHELPETLPRLPKQHRGIWKAKTGLKTQVFLIHELTETLPRLPKKHWTLGDMENENLT